MNSKLIQKIASLAESAEQNGKHAIAKKLDKLAEKLVVNAEIALTVKNAQPTKEQKVEQMHNAINALLSGLASSFVAKYKTDIGLPKQMVTAMSRKLKNSELVDFMKSLGFDYKTWNQMWSELGRFNVKFTKVLNTSRHPFVIGPEFMSAAKTKPTVEIGEPEIVQPTQEAVAPHMPVQPVRPEAGEIQELPEFQTSPELPTDDFFKRKF